jgi:predicted RND superfamily exporter protein
VGRFLVRHRRVLAGIGLVLVAVAGCLSGGLAFSTAIEAMVDRSDPSLEALARVRRAFGSNEVVLATYDAPDLFTPDGLGRLSSLERELAAIPRVRSTTSLASTPLGPGILEADSEAARRLVDLLEGYVVGRDRRTAVVLCLLDPPREPAPGAAAPDGGPSDDASRGDAIDAIRRRVARLPGGTVAGEPVMLRDGFAMLELDGAWLGSLAALLSGLVLLAIFRSVRWVIAPLAVVLAAILGTRGVLAAAGLELTMVSAMLSSMITVVGIATTVHLIVEFRRRRDEGTEPQEALGLAIGRLALPLGCAILTDCIGFGALVASEVGPVRDFGLMTAIGAAAVLLFGTLLMPSLVLDGPLRGDPRRVRGEDWLDRGLDRTGRLLAGHPRSVLAASALGIVITGMGMRELRVETDFVSNFRSDSPIARAYEVVEGRLGGAGVWDLLVPLDGAVDARSLARVAALEERLGALRSPQGEPALTKTLSLAGVIAAVSPVSLEALGGSTLGNIAVAAAVGVVERSLPQVAASLVGRDPVDGSRWLRIMLRSRERQSSAQKRWIIEAVGREAASFGAEDGRSADRPTGVFVLLAGLVERLLSDSWLTLAVAVSGIFLVLAAAFRSPLLAAVALVPNLLPIVVVLGGLGWAGIPINMGTAMIAAVSMGLSIDSSIHCIAAWRRRSEGGAARGDPPAARARAARGPSGMTCRERIPPENQRLSSLEPASEDSCPQPGAAGPRDRLDGVHGTAGRAIVFATLALVVGFLALSSSQFLPTVSFGGFAAVTLLGGLVGNLVVLPVLLSVVAGDSGRAGA